MSTSPAVERPSADTRTPQDTPDINVVDRLIAELAADVVTPHYDDVMDRHGALYEKLCAAVTEDLGDQTTAADFCARCQPAHLRVDEERNAELIVKERMAFMLGLEVAREQSGPRRDGYAGAQPTHAPADDDDQEDVSEVMIRLVSALWLAKSVVDCHIGKDADVHEHGWWALTELLGSAATDLDAAHGRYCTEHNALTAAAASGGAA